MTLGPRGALLSYGEHPLLVPAPAAHHGDACGAGTGSRPPRPGCSPTGRWWGGRRGRGERRHRLRRRGRRGRRAPGRLGTGPRLARPTPTTPGALTARIRAEHGTVVAAGGCFDLLHAGHVGLLQAARHRRLPGRLRQLRRLVRRRKGGGRPVNPLADRVRVLRALACVDAGRRLRRGHPRTPPRRPAPRTSGSRAATTRAPTSPRPRSPGVGRPGGPAALPRRPLLHRPAGPRRPEGPDDPRARARSRTSPPRGRPAGEHPTGVRACAPVAEGGDGPSGRRSPGRASRSGAARSERCAPRGAMGQESPERRGRRSPVARVGPIGTRHRGPACIHPSL